MPSMTENSSDSINTANSLSCIYEKGIPFLLCISLFVLFLIAGSLCLHMRIIAKEAITEKIDYT
jgi:hypothetical protein